MNVDGRELSIKIAREMEIRENTSGTEQENEEQQAESEE